jgi:hypothetical protein
MDAVFGPGGNYPRLSKAICLPSTSLSTSLSLVIMLVLVSY